MSENEKCGCQKPRPVLRDNGEVFVEFCHGDDQVAEINFTRLMGKLLGAFGLEVPPSPNVRPVE